MFSYVLLVRVDGFSVLGSEEFFGVVGHNCASSENCGVVCVYRLCVCVSSLGDASVT